MRRSLFVGLLFSPFFLNGQVKRVDHFFASSPKAEKLFKLFKEELGLPVAWDYRNWGSFASGAVSLGNVSYEFVFFDSVGPTKFDAIALEPFQPVEEFILILEGRQILHDSIERNTYLKKDGSTGGWSTLNMRNLIPDPAGLFICDYKEREKVDSANRKDSLELIQRKGGPLGVILLKEIVVSAPDAINYESKLKKVPGIFQRGTNLFGFTSGTSIRLVNSNFSGIEKLVIAVYSIDNTKAYLELHGLLGNSSGRTAFLNPSAIEGLKIEFVED